MCNQLPALLSDYLDCEQKPASRMTLANHLNECRECLTVVGNLPHLLEREHQAPPTPDLWPGIAARLATKKLHWRRAPFRRKGRLGYRPAERKSPALPGAAARALARPLQRLALALAPKLELQLRGAEIAPQQPAALNADADAAGETNTAGEHAVVMLNHIEALQTFIEQLKEWAREGRSPAWVAETLRFEIDAQHHPLVAAELGKPGLVDRLALRPHSTWLEEVRGAVVKALGDASVAAAGGDVPGTMTAGGHGSTSGDGRQARDGLTKQ